MTWATDLIVPLFVAVLSGGAAAGAIQAFARRRPTKVEAVDKLNESTLEWAEQLKADAADARKDARQARMDAEEIHGKMKEIRREADALGTKMRVLIDTIHAPTSDPQETLTRLRIMTSPWPQNGVKSA